MNPYDAVVGAAISLATALAGLAFEKWGEGLSGGIRQAIVIVLSTVTAWVMSGRSWNAPEIAAAFAQIFASVNVTHAAGKYILLPVVKPKEGTPDVATR